MLLKKQSLNRDVEALPTPFEKYTHYNYTKLSVSQYFFSVKLQIVFGRYDCPVIQISKRNTFQKFRGY
jgi:hypothetical protein